MLLNDFDNHPIVGVNPHRTSQTSYRSGSSNNIVNKCQHTVPQRKHDCKMLCLFDYLNSLQIVANLWNMLS